MKRILGVAGIVIFFLILLALILYKIFAPSTASQKDPMSNTSFPSSSLTPDGTPNAEKFISLCYEKYITAISLGEEQIPTQNFLDNNAICFSKNFTSEWTVATEETGLDPVLLSQDVSAYRNMSIKEELIYQNANIQKYRVTLGGSSNEKVLYVNIIAENNTLKIDRVESIYTN